MRNFKTKGKKLVKLSRYMITQLAHTDHSYSKLDYLLAGYLNLYESFQLTIDQTQPNTVNICWHLDQNTGLTNLFTMTVN